MKKKLFALFMILTLLVCILPAGALAAPSANLERLADYTEQEDVSAGSDEAAPADETTDSEEVFPEDEDAELPEEGTDTATQDEAAPAPTASQTDPTQEEMAAAAALADLIEPDGEAEPAEAPELDYVIVNADQVLYAYEGMSVFNNAGVVYSNLAVVYNNGGTVYNNAGTVYNNGGVVYANGGMVYNNAGTVYNNGAVVYGFGGDVADSMVFGCYELKFADYYEPFVVLDGTVSEPGSEKMLVSEDGVCRISPYPGYCIADAEATAGTIAWDEEDGSVLLSEVHADVVLTLTIQAETPVFDLESGSYAEEKTVSLSSSAGSRIYYTVDGSVPSVETGTLYEEPIVVSESTVLTAIAIADTVLPSEPAVLTLCFLRFTAPEFDAVDEGYARQAARPVIVENDSRISAAVSSVELTGENAEAFTLSSTSGKTILAGKINNSSWSVRPVTELAPGEYRASVVFTLDSGEAVDVPVLFTVNEKAQA